MFSKRALADLCISLLPYIVTLAWTGESELACLLLWLKIMIRPDWHSFCTSSLVLFWGEDVVELQTLITKKVNWAEYNAVLKKLADLRQYVDGMAESVFIGQREALESEFVSCPAFLHIFTPVERKTSPNSLTTWPKSEVQSLQSWAQLDKVDFAIGYRSFSHVIINIIIYTLALRV